MKKRGTCKVIGVGNPLMGDDGLGIVAVEQLRGQLPEDVELIDGGCGGITLLELLVGCDSALIIDAADFGGQAGDIIKLSARQVISSQKCGSQVSLHQTGLADVLQLARQLDQLPETTLFLVQPLKVERGIGLSQPVQETLPRLLDQIAADLASEVYQQT